MKNLILIVGSGRCGTSWLVDWLLSNEFICGPHIETKLFFHIAPICGFSHYTNHMNSIGQGIDNRSICYFDGEIKTLSSQYLHSLIESLCLHPRIYKKNATYYLEKTPEHLYYIDMVDELLGEYYNIRWIHIYRDGRNVVQSISKLGWLKPEASVNRWIFAANSVLSNKKENVLCIKYEELVENPILSKKITDFCGVNFHSCIQPDLSIYNPNRWKESEELLEIFAPMRPYLDQLGYV